LKLRENTSLLILPAMKLLLDENIPQKANARFQGHEVFTVEQMGWKGKENGELLKLMVQEGFNAFVTLDKNLKYQQNLSKYPVIVFLLKASNNKPATIQPLLNKVQEKLSSVLKPQILEVD